MKSELTSIRVGPHAYAVGERFAEDAELPKPTPAVVLKHDRLIRRIMRAAGGSSAALLPARFGMVASDAALKKTLGQLDLKAAFERVRGCVQYTIRVHGKRTKKKKKKHPPLAAEGPGATWLRDRQAATALPEIEALATATAVLVREASIDVRTTATTPPLLAVVFHLVEQSKARAWRSAVAKSTQLLPKTVSVSVTGPWPPYAFAEATP